MIYPALAVGPKVHPDDLSSNDKKSDEIFRRSSGDFSVPTVRLMHSALSMRVTMQ